MSGQTTAGRKILSFLGLLVIFTLVAAPAELLGTPAGAAGNDGGAKNTGLRVVVLIFDYLRLEDLQGDRPNFQGLTGASGLGLMNTRTRSLFATSRSDAYQALGLGMPDLDYPGKLALTARKNGIKVALVGRAGTDPGKLLTDSLAAARNNGLVLVRFGEMTRLGEIERNFTGDGTVTDRIRATAVRKADSFLGELWSKIDRRNTVLMVINPLPAPGQAARGSRSLTPLIIYEPGQPAGVLTSNTTRRPGLVANLDFGATILQKLGITGNNSDFPGEEIKVIPDPDNYQTVQGSLAEYKNLKISRYVIHGLAVLYLSVALAALYRPILTGRAAASERKNRAAFGEQGDKAAAGKQKGRTADGEQDSRTAGERGGRAAAGERRSRAAAVAVLALPAVTLGFFAVCPNRYYYLSLFLTGLITVGLGLSLAGSVHRTLAGLAWLSLAVSVFILVDLLGGGGLLLKTPLGFNDVFQGGRYYGINNDCMGLLLGATMLAMFYFFDRFKIKKHLRLILAVIITVLVALSQTPGYGANIGGTIAAATTGAVAVMALATGKPLRKRDVILVAAAVLVLQLGIAYLDSLAGQQTHAGKMMRDLIRQGMAGWPKIISTKLSLFGLMLLLPPWNVLLGVQVYLSYQVRKRLGPGLQGTGQSFPVPGGFFEVVFYGSLAAFVFNDTGVIAAALMLTYLTMPLGVLLAGAGFLSRGTGKTVEYR